MLFSELFRELNESVKVYRTKDGKQYVMGKGKGGGDGQETNSQPQDEVDGEPKGPTRDKLENDIRDLVSKINAASEKTGVGRGEDIDEIFDEVGTDIDKMKNKIEDLTNELAKLVSGMTQDEKDNLVKPMDMTPYQDIENNPLSSASKSKPLEAEYKRKLATIPKFSKEEFTDKYLTDFVKSVVVFLANLDTDSPIDGDPYSRTISEFRSGDLAPGSGILTPIPTYKVLKTPEIDPLKARKVFAYVDTSGSCSASYGPVIYALKAVYNIVWKRTAAAIGSHNKSDIENSLPLDIRIYAMSSSGCRLVISGPDLAQFDVTKLVSMMDVGSGSDFTEALNHIENTRPENIIIATDSDMDDWTPNREFFDSHNDWGLTVTGGAWIITGAPAGETEANERSMIGTRSNEMVRRINATQDKNKRVFCPIAPSDEEDPSYKEFQDKYDEEYGSSNNQTVGMMLNDADNADDADDEEEESRGNY